LRAQNAQQPGGGPVRETLKVDAGRLDLLIDMIGELVIAESMVSQSGELRSVCSPELARSMTQLDKITRELQEMGTGMRMVPIRATFQKMARLVRDLAKKSGKQVEFVTTGEETELDKSVVDKIGDPLIHMIRNAVDHGLEADPEARVKSGKPAVGRVELRAFHKGGSIYIEIQDDGRGLDRDAILAKARTRGLVREGDVLSDRDVWNLVFEPGLSTAKTVTDVSGRGVGMDVVKRNIEALRGQVEIQSEPGKGTTFSIRLPLTLAIIDGMVVRIGLERYIIPTLSIVMSIRPDASQLSTVVGRGEMLSLQGQLLPLFRLARLFGISDATQELTDGIVMVVEDEGRRTGLLVDEILGQQQIVIKSLGEAMQGLLGVAGGAIMPDGRVGLILDVSGVVRLASEEKSGGICRDTAAKDAQAR
jgi:two-component system chemotaxis sensor kinase CheA